MHENDDSPKVSERCFIWSQLDPQRHVSEILLSDFLLQGLNLKLSTCLYLFEQSSFLLFRPLETCWSRHARIVCFVDSSHSNIPIWSFFKVINFEFAFYKLEFFHQRLFRSLFGHQFFFFKLISCIFDQAFLCPIDGKYCSASVPVVFFQLDMCFTRSFCHLFKTKKPVASVVLSCELKFD